MKQMKRMKQMLREWNNKIQWNKMKLVNEWIQNNKWNKKHRNWMKKDENNEGYDTKDIN